MPSLNFGGNKNKHFNLEPDPLFPNVDPRIRILIHYYGKVDPDPLFPNVDPRIRIRVHVKMRWIRNADKYRYRYRYTYINVLL